MPKVYFIRSGLRRIGHGSRGGQATGDIPRARLATPGIKKLRIKYSQSFGLAFSSHPGISRKGIDVAVVPQKLLNENLDPAPLLRKNLISTNFVARGRRLGTFRHRLLCF